MMKWTKEAPSEPGFYWLRSSSWDRKPIVVEVWFYMNEDPDVFFTGTEEHSKLSDFPRHQWCKIPEPEKLHGKPIHGSL